MEILKCTYTPCPGDIVDGDCDTCGKAYTPTPIPIKTSTKKKRAATTSRRLSVRVTTLRSLQTGATSKPVRKPRSASTHSTRGGMGAGLVEIDVVPPVLPENLLKPQLYTPKSERICNHCLTLGTRTELGFDRGFCKKCRTPYEFEISPGEVVESRYEVIGIFAEGGLGRLYVAKDLRLERTVAIKAMKARDNQAKDDVRRERQALSRAHHPGIVDVVDFIKWGAPNAESDHIVMEFCGGKTFAQILEEDGGKIRPAKALALIYSLLPAFEALHEEYHLLYMDGKPKNFMVVGNQGKILDLGACRLLDDPSTSFLCTPGYEGPEIYKTPEHDAQLPGKTFDIYTLGRTLLEMLLGDEFDWEGEYQWSMPPRDESDILSENEPLYRLLVWMTAPDPADRPQSIAELMEAVYGVLFKTVCYEAKKAGTPNSQRFVSHLFAADRYEANPEIGYRQLPALQINPAAKEWREVQTALTNNEVEKQLRELKHILKQRKNAFEAKLWYAWLLTGSGALKEAEENLRELIDEDPFDPRYAYALGRLRLAQDRPKEAFDLTNAAYTPLCGELATEFALALTAECAGDLQTAELMYTLVFTADPTFSSATFGAARVRLALNDRDAAISALDAVPSNLDSYAAALSTKVEFLTDTVHAAPTLAHLLAASSAIEAGHFGGIILHRLRASVFSAGVFVIQSPNQPKTGSKGTTTLLCGVAIEPKLLRDALEIEYRTCAKLAITDSREEAWNYVLRANETGNRRLF